jgi:hypothetical protein
MARNFSISGQGRSKKARRSRTGKPASTQRLVRETVPSCPTAEWVTTLTSASFLLSFSVCSVFIMGRKGEKQLTGLPLPHPLMIVT